MAAVLWSCEGSALLSDKGYDVCSQEKCVQCARTLIHTCLLVPGENRAAGRQVRSLFTVYPIQKTRQALTEERFARKTALFVNKLHSGLKTKEMCLQTQRVALAGF